MYIRIVLPILFICSWVLAGDNKKNVGYLPEGEFTNEIVSNLDYAKHSIFVVNQDLFVSDPIINALIRAKSRGVDVQIIIENGGGKYNPKNSAKILADSGVSVFIYEESWLLPHRSIFSVDRGYKDGVVIQIEDSSLPKLRFTLCEVDNYTDKYFERFKKRSKSYEVATRSAWDNFLTIPAVRFTPVIIIFFVIVIGMYWLLPNKQ